MTWLTWRQFRLQATAGALALAAAAVALLITGLGLRHLFDTSGVVSCTLHGDCPVGQKGGVGPAAAEFLTHYRILQQLVGPALLALPGLIGIFWGAPLVARELETGTYRLAWTQSVSRARWLAVKVALIGLASMALAGLFSLLVSWWFSPLDRVNLDRFDPGTFDERGVVVIGYAAVAFAIGVLAGIVLRRTLLAMASTLVAFVGLRLALTFAVRPKLEAPVHASAALTLGQNLGFEVTPIGVIPFAQTPQIPNAWVYSTSFVAKTGHPAGTTAVGRLTAQLCPALLAAPDGQHDPPAAAFNVCAHKLAGFYHLFVSYQPANRFWAFQASELIICLALAATLLGAGFWWLRRRLV
jgi:hypothetical protein